MAFHVPEKYRVKNGAGPYNSDSTFGNNGLFHIKTLKTKRLLHVLAGDGAGWEHVSVSLPGQLRCPTWEEMSVVKGMFWDDEDIVMQLHPSKSEYVSYHPYCLHLWRPIGLTIPTPPGILVGPKCA